MMIILAILVILILLGIVAYTLMNNNTQKVSKSINISQYLINVNSFIVLITNYVSTLNKNMLPIFTNVIYSKTFDQYEKDMNEISEELGQLKVDFTFLKKAYETSQLSSMTENELRRKITENVRSIYEHINDIQTVLIELFITIWTKKDTRYYINITTLLGSLLKIHLKIANPTRRAIIQNYYDSLIVQIEQNNLENVKLYLQKINDEFYKNVDEWLDSNLSIL